MIPKNPLPRLFAVFAVLAAAAAAPRVAALPVANVAEVTNALQNWTVGDLTLEFQAGTYELNTAILPGVPWATASLPMPGSLTLRGLDPFPGRVVVQVSFPLRPASAKSVTVEAMKFSGPIDTSLATPGGAVVVFNRVWLDAAGGPTGANINPGSSLFMKSCCVTGANINARGISDIRRCTFISGTLELGSAVNATLNSNLFIAPPNGIGGPNVTGALNYLPGMSSVGAPEFALDGSEMVPSTPPFDTNGTGNAWPGKLAFSFRPRGAFTTPGGGPVQDFEGQTIVTTRNEVGADEVGIDFPLPAWVSCEITGTAGATLYAEPDDVPIVNGGAPLTIEVVGRNMTNEVAEAIEDLEFALVFQRFTDGVTEDTLLPRLELPLDFDSGEATGDSTNFSFTTTFTPPATIDWNGIITVYLKVGAEVFLNTELDTTFLDQQFILDTVPPRIPAAIDFSAVSSTADTNGVVTCGGWQRVINPDTDADAPDGTAPHFFLNSAANFDVTFTIPLEDGSVPRIDGTLTPPSGFLNAPLTTSDTSYTITQFDDAVFDVRGIGTARWTEDTLGVLPALGTSATATASATQARWTISASDIENADITTSVVRDFEANLAIVDRAGNETVVPLSARFWWMPPGSVYPVVTATGTAKNPGLSWAPVFANASTASPGDLPPGCPILATILPCGLNGGTWESLSGLDWSQNTTARSISREFRVGTNAEATLDEVFRGALGVDAMIAVLITDPAGNDQNGGPIETSLATNETIIELTGGDGGNHDRVGVTDIIAIPSTPPDGEIDTAASVKFFLNRTDRGDIASLWSIDPDETTFGVGPNVPLTPIAACGQRLEVEVTVDAFAPDVLAQGNTASDLSVEFQLFEGGNLVARGNLRRPVNSNSTEPFKLYIPTDLMDRRGGSDRGTTFSGTNVFIPDNIGIDAVEFLNQPPSPCESSAGLHNLNAALVGDRLGDDGNPENKDTDGSAKRGFRSRPVAYTLVLTATTYPSSSIERQDGFEYDATPATIQFFVKPDISTDSSVPPIKVNESR